MRNPFRHSGKRRQFDLLIDAWQRQDKLLFTRNGTPHRSNSFAAHFWAGFAGTDGGLFRPGDRIYQGSASYVFYRAGAACRERHEEKNS